jgi:hypothetical protein
MALILLKQSKQKISEAQNSKGNLINDFRVNIFNEHHG